MPNKFFDSMKCGIPKITNITGGVVEDTGCGLIVIYGDVNQLKQAIIDLRDILALRKKLGNTRRKVFVEKYKWTFVEN
jgi:glycosyltransferase involved in cell wall biosynthesis